MRPRKEDKIIHIFLNTQMTFKEILDGIDADALARMRRKVPEWNGVEGLVFPTRLSMEQCSSSATALYKAALISRIFTGRGSSGGCAAAEAFPQRSEDGMFSLRRGTPSSEKRPVVIDLTGGLGVDCWAFSGIASHVHHNEMDPTLSNAVRTNFEVLGITDASFSSIEVAPGKVNEVIAACGNEPDIIFLDPARRSSTGKKVFLLEDCSPDILTLKEELLSSAPDILVKLSPMADITMVCRRLGAEVKEVHVVEADGECKELLVWMSRGWSGGYEIVFKELRFTPEEENGTVPVLVNGIEELESDGCLFEPSSSLLKSGCFNLVCGKLGLKKLGRFTHLYLASADTADLAAYGKTFSISKVLPFNGQNLKSVGKEYPQCEVTSRNLPLTSDELRRKMGVKSGGGTHVFACTADFLESGSQRIIMITSRIQRQK